MRTETATWIGNVPGFCEGLPGGEYIFNIPGGGVRWQEGMRALPGANTSASYCRLSPDGVGVICQGQDDDRAWMWNGAWMDLGVFAFGPNACIFDAQGGPRVISTAPAVGCRYVAESGAIVTCEATYADPARGLYEWTEDAEVAIGQGGKPDQGAVVLFRGGKLQRLTIAGQPVLGTIRNVRVRRSGDDFAIGFCNYDTRTATILWCSLAELREMPFVTAAPAPPTPPTTKHPTPEPKPMNQAPDRQIVVAGVLLAHPEINALDEDSLTTGRAAIVDWAAQRMNKIEGRVIWGRKSRGKPNGDRAVNPNTDGLTYLRTDGRFEIIDVINGSDGSSSWHNYGPVAPGENGWWAPPQLGPEPGTPAPGPTTPAPKPPQAGLPASLHVWIHGEYPQLVAAYKTAHADDLDEHGNIREPGHEWAAFQTYRRWVEGWSLERMLKHERGQ